MGRFFLFNTLTFFDHMLLEYSMDPNVCLTLMVSPCICPEIVGEITLFLFG